MKMKAFTLLFVLMPILSACVTAESGADTVKDAWIPVDAKLLQVNCELPNAPDLCEDLPDFQRPQGGQLNAGQLVAGQMVAAQMVGGNLCNGQLEQCHVAGDEDCDGKSDCEDSDCDNMACDDTNLCTHHDTCTMGVCQGTEIVCASEACIERTCNGTESCTVVSRDQQACDDGNACTYGDICQGDVCVGPNIAICNSDTCVDRSCNGTASCTENFKDGSGCDDGNACTHSDVCAGGGCLGQAVSCVDGPFHFSYCNGTTSCTIVTKEDGIRCGDAKDRCCAGDCVNTAADEWNCGGCGIRCNTGKTCYAGNNNTTGYCSCGGNMDCIVGSNGNDFTCWDLGNGSPMRCNCQQDTDCAVGQTCHVVTGHNYCSY